MGFSIGDVVMLKSGGPALTVSEIAEAGITCVWYADAEENFRSTILPADCLVPVDMGDEEDEDDEDEDDETD